MKDLILFGAYDRFNFGDMMMPLAIARWIERNRPDVLERYRLRYASLTESDMRDRDCLPTEAILKVCATASEDAVIVVTGGEVLEARRAGLFMHNSRSDAEHREKGRLRRKDPEAFTARMIEEIGDIWEFPYLPPQDCLPTGGRVMFNAIGGQAPDAGDEEDIRWARFAQADYISVRDERLARGLFERGREDVQMAPCAVGLIAEGYFRDLDDGARPCDEPYFVVQCVHNPKNIDQTALAEQVRSLSEASGLRPVLVPLATASGHSDHKALEAVHAELGDLAVMDEERSLSSILTAFRNAEFYTGTSLHGTITAMAYGIPYYPFKKSISKLGAYLGAWSPDALASLREVRRPGQISAIPWQDRSTLAAPLQENAQRLSRLAGENIARWVDRLD